MDDFKRCYSNEDESKSIPYFWEKFDPENYSVWLGEYKYNDELQKVFMSCNLITGTHSVHSCCTVNPFTVMLPLPFLE
jgi:elongation factor 1-gamma